MNTEATTPARGTTALVAATAVSVTGDGILLAAAPLLAASLTRDPLAIAAVTAAGFAPWLLIGLPAGALVDRWNRKAVMIGADLVRAAVLATMVALLWTGAMNMPVLVAAILVIGVASCLFEPASHAILPALVSREPARLAAINAKLWSADTFGRALAGPPLGSATFAAAPALPFGLDLVSFLISAALLTRVRPAHVEPAARTTIRAAVVEGVTYLMRHPMLRSLAMGMTGYNLGYNVAAGVLVLYAQDVLHVTTAGYGLLLAVGAIGAVAAGPLAPKIIGRRTPRQIYAAAYALQAACWALVVATANPWVTAAALALLSVGSGVTTINSASIRQRLTPDTMLGRITAATRLLGIGSAAIGALLGGTIATLTNLTTAITTAIVVLAAGAATFALSHEPRPTQLITTTTDERHQADDEAPPRTSGPSRRPTS
ncbi:hypothetical protein Lfu02_00780 [Longispora fulva]|uniref:MFS family permease n=1 Tax=Longispora fulva TaxID=619741 RepID=A0A8J7KW30_9ACTN|nr:MFS transporter [Longispora fulva]MBG6136052.1 MFS family permease [Longispora fulva]GIG55706.1 hypothetical protein Lfu02_00780 [Longispora fulva]